MFLGPIAVPASAFADWVLQTRSLGGRSRHALNIVQPVEGVLRVKIRIALLAAAALTTTLSACRSTTGEKGIETGTDTVDATLPTQLPRTAIPSHYAIEVTPHADALAFDGKVAIDLKVIKPTRELTLNALNLKISNATITPAGQAPLPAKIALDAEKQTATFGVDRELA